MPTSKHLRSSDLRAAARLATDATAGLTDLVEAMHAGIARGPGRPDSGVGRTTGITGLVYRSVRGVTRLVGGSVDGLLSLLQPVLQGNAPSAPPSAEREAVIAALNGVLGDHLEASHNPLATPMALRVGGVPLVFEREAIARAVPDAGAQLLVLLHGLCMNDRQWLREGQDHGRMLATAGGFNAVYLHCNTGLHISVNGRALAQQLEDLTDAWPHGLQRIVLLGHSMGGLIARSAVHQARTAGHRWPALVKQMVFVGTPHHGAPLERAGHGVDLLLAATPYARPLARLGQVRSAGITDLRHGLLLDEDWAGRDRFARGADPRHPLPLPDGIECFAAAGSVGEPGSLKDRLLGDGLVPLDSALGRHADAARTLRFADDHQWIGPGVGHLQLLSDPDLAARLRAWLC